jgi:hypothetical protein
MKKIGGKGGKGGGSDYSAAGECCLLEKTKCVPFDKKMRCTKT